MGAVSPRRFLTAVSELVQRMMQLVVRYDLAEGEKNTAALAYTAFHGMMMQPGGLPWLQTQVIPFDFQFFIPEEMKDFGRELCDNRVVPLPGPYTLLSWKEYTTDPGGGNLRDLGGSSHCLVVDLEGKDWLGSYSCCRP
jgi:hypothetical protein